jgi:hypothetical protein
VGLIARAIESVGIPTVTLSLAKDLTEAVGTPRAVFVKWPLGHPLGEPHNAAQQRTMIFTAFQVLQSAEVPGHIVEPAFRWRREQYSEPVWERLRDKEIER